LIRWIKPKKAGNTWDVPCNNVLNRKSRVIDFGKFEIFQIWKKSLISPKSKKSIF